MRPDFDGYIPLVINANNAMKLTTFEAEIDDNGEIKGEINTPLVLITEPALDDFYYKTLSVSRNKVYLANIEWLFDLKSYVSTTYEIEVKDYSR